MISEDVISNNIVKCEKYGNATTVVPCTTVVLKKTDDEYSEEVVDRDTLLLTQTPQAFILKDILSAHEEAKEKGITNSVASCTLMAELGGKTMHIVPGSEKNIKVTTVEDLEMIKALMHVHKEDWLK